ncbi:hypothetical protein Esi_0056_0082 [Ectocarpus siliculosus]|uniref:Uncharacterized protein n=1 Tax=Ectocarpus siliculosus TaxID=2880 RepID=D8LPZ7_ECTSI|nr:hypothetical protein Esi_0056_0082 [Ectocarpus siliculosus]|eukprot:CBN74889.1 hypothetical protein Esi_0056_0082 [Ectocarpus siliculosus]
MRGGRRVSGTYGLEACARRNSNRWPPKTCCSCFAPTAKASSTAAAPRRKAALKRRT